MIYFGKTGQLKGQHLKITVARAQFAPGAQVVLSCLFFLPHMSYLIDRSSIDKLESNGINDIFFEKQDNLKDSILRSL